MRRSIPSAWKQIRLLHAGKIAGAIAISAFNVLWEGHGVIRSSPTAVRLIAVALVCYVVTTIAEFLWLLSTGPRFTGFESPNAPATGEFETIDPIIDQLKSLPPADLREETLQLAGRSEERRVGKECVQPCRSRWSPYH